MAITALNTLKSWFLNGLKPPQEQFWAWMNSFWHKSEKIPMSNIDGLNTILQNLPTEVTVNNLIEQVAELQNAPQLGIQKGVVVQLTANEVNSLTLLDNSKLYAIELLSVGNVSVGTDPSAENLGNLDGDVGGWLDTGIVNASKIYFKADSDMSIQTHIYRS